MNWKLYRLTVTVRETVKLETFINEFHSSVNYFQVKEKLVIKKPCP